MAGTVIVWFRNDLRLADNPALEAAIATGKNVVPVYIWAPEEEAPWQPGGASKWWLHHSLTSLAASLEKKGSKLILREGGSLEELQKLIQETKAEAIFWNRRYEPVVIERDTKIKAELKKQGLVVDSFHGSLLFEPVSIKTKEGKPYQVYTRFWLTCLEQPAPDAAYPVPNKWSSPETWPTSITLDSLKLLPTIPWDTTMKTTWKPGEAPAQQLLKEFLSKVGEYQDQRNFPSTPGTSRLSPYLHFGEISPRQIWHAVREKQNDLTPAAKKQAEVYLKEVVWREFAYYLLYHFPHTTTDPLREDFKHFPWNRKPSWLHAWQKGQTGYPIVDAGMRELWATGWMHNRVRMVVASFLVKHLLIPWQKGAEWFWDTLVDADLSSNTLGWQWTAGCGADAAPYFRVFNPILQGEKFDPEGDYVRKWVPELKDLPKEIIHQPWTAEPMELLTYGVTLDKNYPRPIVEHGEARDKALAAFAELKKFRK